jgi:hypothetical protein
MLARRILAATLAALFVANGLYAAPRPPTDKEIAKVKKQAGQLFNEGARVIVEMRDGRKLQGSIHTLEAQEFVLVDGAYDSRLAYADVKKLKRVSLSLKSRRAVGLAVVGGIIGLAIFGASQAR